MTTELVLVDGLSPEDVALVHREALVVLRSDLDQAWLEARSDHPWPPEVLDSYESLLALAREAVAAGTRSPESDPGTAIGIDPHDDAQFDLFSDLAPYTTGAEAWRDDELVFSTSDTGSTLRFFLTDRQEAELHSRLDALGIPPTVLEPA
ncbi:hypothetical protein ACIA8O_30510 [Kitasatospora sp. NPDC051853]|uniref:hypothetical protein n=1 Tax=Kitasatospora sp. NPDC051853 TaxID=3364058 RepID=UPI0037AA1FB9